MNPPQEDHNSMTGSPPHVTDEDAKSNSSSITDVEDYRDFDNKYNIMHPSLNPEKFKDDTFDDVNFVVIKKS